MEKTIRRYLAQDKRGERAAYTFEIVRGPAMLGGNRSIVLAERGAECIKAIDISHDDWALDDFGGWCMEYMVRALKLSGIEEISAQEPQRPNRLDE